MDSIQQIKVGRKRSRNRSGYKGDYYGGGVLVVMVEGKDGVWMIIVTVQEKVWKKLEGKESERRGGEESFTMKRLDQQR